ncbi:MAG: hypothetical protein HYW24_00145 [Candidatus Aenigmarchaeota archaeon]|nr:hypothetical protein [Candidatus Aenigmarchaeota archaeon]
MSYGRMRMSGNIYEPVPETVTGDPSVGLSPIMDIDKFDPGTPWWEIYRNDLVIKRIEEAPPEVIEQQKKTIQ